MAATSSTRLVELEVIGLDKIERKLRGSLLLDPALEEAKDTIVARIVDRPGKGLGARNNQLNKSPLSLGARIVSTLRHPRRSGVAWQRKNQQIVNSMTPRVVSAAIDRIESDFVK